MKLYSEKENYKLYQGNMLDMLEVIESNTIDSVVCDPPYELNFMGKGWDNSGIAFQPDTWKKCYEVLKPGGYLLAFGGSRTFHRIACAIEDAGFEIRDTIMWIYGCYSSDTQVLTNKGWKYFYELDKTEKILQWNSETNELIWEVPKKFYEYDIDDEMVLFENRHTSQLVTKNHNMVLKIRKHSRLPKSNKWEVIKAQDVKKYWAIDLPLAGELKTGKKERHAYMIGWWLTDAWKHQDGKACMFSQSKPETLKKLKEGLDKENAQYSEYIKKPLKKEHKPEHTFYVRGELADYLLEYFPERKLKEEVLTWDEESRKELVRGLMDGDGSMQECRGYSRVFWSKNHKRLDIFSALCVTLNMRSYIDYKKGCVYFNEKRNTTQMEYRHRKPNQQYQGKVYCFETTTGAFVVRRNGKPFIGRNSGFPKSMDISKQLDKRNGRNINTDFMNYLIENRKKKGLSINKVAELGGWFGNINHGGSVSNWEKGVNIPTKEQYKKLKEILELDDKYDEYINICEAEREVIGQHNFGASSIFGSETYQHRENGKIIDITIPETDLAKQWQGWGTALKPSYESIIVARKPFKGSLVDNVIEYGVGGINIDECRVEYEKTTNPATNPLYRQQNADKYKQVQGGELSNGAVSWTSGKNGVSEMGRFPANTILTYDETDFNEVCGGFPYTKSGGGDKSTKCGNTFLGTGYGGTNTTNYQANEGSASRYFYCAKASKKDRDEGLDEQEEVKVNDGRNTPIDNPFQRGETPRKNTHCCVKPTTLMQYLVRLVSPNGATILDPFNGSGSTGKAVMYENKERNKNYKYIGIELTEEYLPIAKARIEYVCNLKEEESPQMTIFDMLGDDINE